jgi:class 3 adenylate cyclase
MRLLRRVTLLQWFSLISLIGVVLISLLLGLLISDAIESSTISTTRNNLTDLVRSHVIVRDPVVEAGLNAVNPPSPISTDTLLLLTPDDFQRTHPDGADEEYWHRSAINMFSGIPIYLIKVWRPDHTIIWSDRLARIGEQQVNNPELDEALRGEVLAEISPLDKSENAAEAAALGIANASGNSSAMSLLEVYVPILERGTFRVVGVYEVYQQVDTLLTQIRLAQTRAWTAITLSMAVLYLALVGLFARASRTIQRLGRLQELERYFSPAVARAIAAGESKPTRRLLPRLAGQKPTLSRQMLTRGEISVLFTDIRGFTRQSETMDAEDVVEMLNAYMDVVTTAVFGHHGSIDKFLGDGVLAVFGAPLPDPNHALDAVRAACDIRAGLEELNTVRWAAGQVPIVIGAAVATGLAVTGNIGSDKQLSFTVTGDTVNLGSRLVGMAQAGEVLITARTYELMQVDAETGATTGPWHVVGPQVVSIRGREEPATIYNLEPPGLTDLEAAGDSSPLNAPPAGKPAYVS